MDIKRNRMQDRSKFRAKRGITLIETEEKLTRLCSHAPVAPLLPVCVGQWMVNVDFG